MAKSLSTEPLSTWLQLPRTAAEARRRGGTFYFTGGKCANRHVAPMKVDRGCTHCIALGHAREEVGKTERAVRAEMKRLGRAYRPATLSPKTAAARVLLAIARVDGVLARADLVDHAGRGMSEGTVHRAFATLIKRGFITEKPPYVVTAPGAHLAISMGVEPRVTAFPRSGKAAEDAGWTLVVSRNSQ